MYIHRIAIDQNRINAFGRIAEMTVLERYHDAQVIEIVQTSTLKADNRQAYPIQKEKAAKYRTIGSDGVFYFTNGAVPDANIGSTATDSRMSEILRIIFPQRAANPSVQDVRDALHVDQVMQNAVDWFVTQDKAIRNAQSKLAAAGIDVRIGDAPDVLAAIEGYFRERFGTLDVAVLRTELMRDFESHPVIVGSNRVGIWELKDPRCGELMFFTRLIGKRMGVGAALRHSNGSRLVTIEPGTTPRFECSGPSLRMMAGESHLLVGDQPCDNFAVSFEGMTILEGRVARSGHIVISRGIIRSSTGSMLASINRESLTLWN